MAADFTDPQFLQRLRTTFAIEAEEHLQGISSQLVKLEQPDEASDGSRLEAVFRHFHSLKGAARAINLYQVEKLCQASESLLHKWRNKSLLPDNALFDVLHAVVDKLGEGIPDLDGNLKPLKDADVAAVIATLEKLSGRLLQSNRIIAPAKIDLSGGVMTGEPAAAAADALPPATDRTGKPEPGGEQRVKEAASRTGSVRVPTEKLNYLLTQTEELITFKEGYLTSSSTLKNIIGDFQTWNQEWSRVQAVVSSYDKQAEAGGGAPGAVGGSSTNTPAALTRKDENDILKFLLWNANQVKVLQESLRQLSGTITRDAQVADRLINDLLAASKQLLMLPLSTVTDMVLKLVRDLSREQGKLIDVELSGADMELDKRGKIRIDVVRASNNMAEINISDDGAGIDLKKIREIAREDGFITPGEDTALTTEEEMMLVFRSGLSTRATATEISGRGMGLPIVMQAIQDLRGKVTVSTTRQQGTNFRILLPLIFGTLNGLLISAAKQLFIFPTSHIDRLIRVPASDVKWIHDRQWIIWNSKTVAYFDLAEVLGLTRSTMQDQPDTLTLLLTTYGNELVVFGIDEVLSVQEVLVKNLRKPLLRVRYIQSASILESGQVIPILNVHDLLREARKGNPATTERPARPDDRAANKTKENKKILLAEDSITSRMLLKGILETAGYTVVTAMDGIEAITHLRTEDFDLIISDIEMPRMNGFDLTTTIRQDKKLAHKPVVLITALSSRQDRERGIEVGANAYLVKSSFEQSNLLDIVQRLA